MSQPFSSKTPSNFQSNFNNALRSYQKRTRQDLLLHSLAPRLQSCRSSVDTLSLLEEQSPSGDGRLTTWLSPTVKVLHSLSSSLGEDVGLVLSPANVIFVAIGVLLSLAQSVSANLDALINIFTRIQHLFRRLETYTEVPPTKSIKELNEKVMLAVLSIFTLVTEEIKQGRAKKYFKKLVGRADIEDKLQRLDELTVEEAQMAAEEVQKINYSVVSEGITPHHAQEPQVATVAHGAGDLTRPSTSSTVTNRALNALQGHQLLAEVQAWLSPPDPSANYNVACQVRHKGTTDWFRNGRTFQKWKSTGSFLWIHGKPGSGKSILCSAIIENIQTMCRAGLASMAYFFFDFKDNQKQTRLDMIPSLLTQLSAQPGRCRDILSRLYLAHNRGSQMPTGGVLTECLKDMLSQPGQCPVYLIMDAIDECPNTPGVPSPREEILELVKELVELRLPNLRLCITSRPEFDIRAVLEPLPSLRVSLHDETGQKEDIIGYIQAVVDSDKSIRRWREEDKQLVISILSERANGMFRWVYCQLDTLRRCFPSSVRHILDDLPQSLDETYERILMEINIGNRKHARRLLQCLTTAIRPLRVEELAEVLAVDFDAGDAIPNLNVQWRWEDQERAVLSACSSLVAVVTIDGSRVVQFSHPSVKEFLTSPRLATSSERASFYYVELEPAHTILAQACLSVLLRLDDGIDKGSSNEFPLAEYAARHWVDHAHFGNVASYIQHGMELLFDPAKSHFAAWVWIYDVDESLVTPTPHPMRPPADPLYYSVLCGFEGLVEHLIDHCRMNVNARGGRYVTPLHAALYKGHIAIAVLLIERGAAVNAQDDEDRTPLRMALHSGNLEVVRPLLGHGADVDIQDDKRSTPLHIASRSSLANAVQLLLENRARVNAQDGNGQTPLHIASESGNSDIVRILLDHGADVTTPDKDGLTSLHLVSVKRNLEIVEWLIERGANVDAQDNKGSTPLHLALVHGNQQVAELLIQHNAAVNIRDNKESTPLHLASLVGNLDIVQLLVHRGTNVKARDKKCQTPLHLASDNGNLEIVRLLIERGADVDARDNKHSTPLHVASRRGPSGVVRLLLEKGADPNAQNDKGWSPLHIAVQEDAVDVVRCLLTLGAEVNLGDADRRTPLHVAAKDKDKKSKIVPLLLEHGADPCAQDNRGQIPYQLRPTAAAAAAARGQ